MNKPAEKHLLNLQLLSSLLSFTETLVLFFCQTSPSWSPLIASFSEKKLKNASEVEKKQSDSVRDELLNKVELLAAKEQMFPQEETKLRADRQRR